MIARYVLFASIVLSKETLTPRLLEHPRKIAGTHLSQAPTELVVVFTLFCSAARRIRTGLVEHPCLALTDAEPLFGLRSIAAGHSFQVQKWKSVADPVDVC
jgi:hypothetical protein